MKQLWGLYEYLTSYLLIRYVISGGTSAFVDLLVLYILNSIFGVHYLVAAVAAFLVAFCVSFVLQKFWTFRHTSRENMHRQVGLYLSTSLLGLLINTALMYVFVDHLLIFPLLAQIYAGILVACVTFFLSRYVVFRHRHQTSV